MTRFYPELSKKITPRKVSLHLGSWVSIALWIPKAVLYILGKKLSQHYRQVSYISILIEYPRFFRRDLALEVGVLMRMLFSMRRLL